MKYRTCVSIAEKTPKKLNSTLTKALKTSDYAELRFDFLKPSDVPAALELVKKNLKKCVCTLRPKSEGGKFSGKENERISIIKLISEYKPYLLDVEFNTLKKNKKLQNYIKKTKNEKDQLNRLQIIIHKKQSQQSKNKKQWLATIKCLGAY